MGSEFNFTLFIIGCAKIAAIVILCIVLFSGDPDIVDSIGMLIRSFAVK